MKIVEVLREKQRLAQFSSRIKNNCKTAVSLLQDYKGTEPFAGYLKKFFAADKKYGSRDRKYISSLCYYYFRLGKAVSLLPVEERIYLGIFLCEQTNNELLAVWKPEWNDHMADPLSQKISIAGQSFSTPDMFPFEELLSPTVDANAYAASFLVQPDLYARLRQKRRESLVQKLHKSGLPFEMKDEDCISLHNGTNTEALFATDREAVIQDYNSQQVLNYLKLPEVQASLEPFYKFRHENRHTRMIDAWDCCAASGGKSILLYDILNRTVKPTVSDIRMPILLNLHQRFKKAGIRSYDYFIGDLEKNVLPEITNAPFPIIICDAPCTGSGTWGRTPEQLFYFKKELVDLYSEKQKAIVTNAIPFLAQDGLFFYITCSVFQKENEAIAEFIRSTTPLVLLHMETLKGYDKKADTMFVAIFRK